MVASIEEELQLWLERLRQCETEGEMALPMEQIFILAATRGIYNVPLCRGIVAARSISKYNYYSQYFGECLRCFEVKGYLQDRRKVHSKPLAAMQE